MQSLPINVLVCIHFIAKSFFWLCHQDTCFIVAGGWSVVRVCASCVYMCVIQVQA
jgi:hypothetical protein